jgi:hypothetical protein
MSDRHWRQAIGTDSRPLARSGLVPMIAQVFPGGARSGTLRPSPAIQPMKILTKTPTSLHLRDNLAKYLFRDLSVVLVLSCLLFIFLFLTPDRMELRCQRTQTNIDCQVTTWNMLSLNSQTQSIQLQDAQAEKPLYPKGGLRLVLKTTGGEIFFTSMFRRNDQHAIYIQNQIRDFLRNSSQPKLNVVEEDFAKYILSILPLFGWFSRRIPLLLRSPVWIEWKFELEPDIADRAAQIGNLRGRFRGFFWKKSICHPFGDVIQLNTDIFNGERRHPEYRLYLKVRSVGEIALSPQGLSEAQWREITGEISEILQIAPPELPQDNLWQRLQNRGTDFPNYR